MLRAFFCSVAALAIFAVGMARADDARKVSDNQGKTGAPATITKVDAQKGTVNVRMKDKDGKDVERAFQLTQDVEYLDSTGVVVTLAVFQVGDEILIIESEGKIKGLRKSGARDRTPSIKKSEQPGDKDQPPSIKKSDDKKPGEK